MMSFSSPASPNRRLCITSNLALYLQSICSHINWITIVCRCTHRGPDFRKKTSFDRSGCWNKCLVDQVGREYGVDVLQKRSAF